MANVKHGKDIITEQDLQNLVIGVINRQTEEFTVDNIVDTVKHFMKESLLKIKDADINKLITANLDYLYRKGLVDCTNDRYKCSAI